MKRPPSAAQGICTEMQLRRAGRGSERDAGILFPSKSCERPTPGCGSVLLKRTAGQAKRLPPPPCHIPEGSPPPPTCLVLNKAQRHLDAFCFSGCSNEVRECLSLPPSDAWCGNALED
eukprot:scaffold895_cov315-Pinguiococcus_pyrenoidosus.AAC.36